MDRRNRGFSSNKKEVTLARAKPQRYFANSTYSRMVVVKAYPMATVGILGRHSVANNRSVLIKIGEGLVNPVATYYSAKTIGKKLLAQVR